MMSRNNEEAKAANRRTQVRDIPQPEKELTKEEQKQVKGGNAIYKVVVNHEESVGESADKLYTLSEISG